MSVYGGVRITQNPAIFSGRLIINGHRITVHDIVARHQLGESIDEIAGGYRLTQDEVTAALAYYKDHKAMIDREIVSDEREIARRAAADTSPEAIRVRERVKALERYQNR